MAEWPFFACEKHLFPAFPVYKDAKSVYLQTTKTITLMTGTRIRLTLTPLPWIFLGLFLTLPCLIAQARSHLPYHLPGNCGGQVNGVPHDNQQASNNVRGTFSARIVDAETGEELPFTQIYISEGRGTIANSEGKFSIDALPSETLTITCMGYQRVRIKAADLPSTLRLSPATIEMREVTVVPSGDILEQVVRNMEADYNAHRKAHTYYYMRQTYRMGEAVEMAEAYFTAGSACNLRRVEFLAGRVFHEKSNGKKTGTGLLQRPRLPVPRSHDKGRDILARSGHPAQPGRIP